MAQPTAAERRIAAMLKTLQPSVQKAFKEAIAAHVGSIDAKALERLIAEGRLQEAIDLLRVNQAFTFPLTEAVRASFIAGGSLTKDALPLVIRAQFGFGNNPRAEQWARAMSSTMIQAVDDNLPVIQGYIATAANEGIPARRVALDITGRMDAFSGRRSGGLLGLNVPQTEWAISARGELARLDDHYFTRTLRDKRLDPLVRRAIRDGKPLTSAEIDKIAGRYSDRLLAARGRVIAQTETLNALRAGQREGWLQAVETGAVDAAQIERTWLATKDGRTRHDHTLMNGQAHRGMSEPYTFPDGTMALFPGDSSLGASAKETILCRCVEVVRLKRPKNDG